MRPRVNDKFGLPRQAIDAHAVAPQDGSDAAHGLEGMADPVAPEPKLDLMAGRVGTDTQDDADDAQRRSFPSPGVDRQPALVVRPRVQGENGGPVGTERPRDFRNHLGNVAQRKHDPANAAPVSLGASCGARALRIPPPRAGSSRQRANALSQVPS